MASRTGAWAHSETVFVAREGSSFEARPPVDKFVGILPEINLPETCALPVLARLALFEVELARRQRGRHERRRAGPDAPFAGLPSGRGPIF
jgi:hypothetical protein